MIHLYIAPSCSSCRKAQKWLDDHHVEYTLHHLLFEPLSDAEIKQMLRLTETGTSELLAPRSKEFQELDVRIEDLSLQKFFDLVRSHPKLLRRPIILDSTRIALGYNEEEIRCFLPREERRINLARRMEERMDHTEDKMA